MWNPKLMNNFKKVQLTILITVDKAWIGPFPRRKKENYQRSTTKQNNKQKKQRLQWLYPETGPSKENIIPMLLNLFQEWETYQLLSYGNYNIDNWIEKRLYPKTTDQSHNLTYKYGYKNK